MATTPEKQLIPLFFNKSKRGPLSKLLRSDSLLRHLMDP